MPDIRLDYPVYLAGYPAFLAGYPDIRPENPAFSNILPNPSLDIAVVNGVSTNQKSFIIKCIMEENKGN